MTRDIFDAALVGTLDIIIHAVMAALDLHPENLTSVGRHDSLDTICERNARRLVFHFVGRPVEAVKRIRAVSGLGLKDSKDAWEQIIESYVGNRKYYSAAAIAAIEQGNLDGAQVYLNRARVT